MLTRLKIKNFAIVSEADLRFQEGFSVITGETGVGKSLLINALNAALGERIFRDVIRTGAEKAEVEAHFKIPKDVAAQAGSSSSEPLVIRREIRRSGTSRAWLNGKPATLQQLQEVAALLVDIHGQHEHQRLLQQDHHLDYLDAFGGLEELRRRTAAAYEELRQLKNKLEQQRQQRLELEQQRELYAFQLQELDKLDPQPGELEELERELKILENTQRISDLVLEMHQILDSAPGLIAGIQQLQTSLEQLTEFAEQAKSFIDEIQAARLSLEGLGEFLTALEADLPSDSTRLEQAHQRLGALRHACRKYNRTYEELLEYRQFLRESLSGEMDLEHKEQELEQAVARALRSFSELSLELSRRRQQEAEKFSQAVGEHLEAVGLEKARFEVQVEQVEAPEGIVEWEGRKLSAGPEGIDRVSFWFQANPGELMRPLVRIASGGEISRVMLAIKSALSDRDPIDTLVFDEIDAGISGRIARVVGRKLRELGQHRQVLCITHLPQIASLGKHHYRVEKITRNERTFTQVRLLNAEERVQEIAALLGAGEITEPVRQAAESLLHEN